MTQKEKLEFCEDVETFLEMFIVETYHKYFEDNFFYTMMHLDDSPAYRLSLAVYDLVDEIMETDPSVWYGWEDHRCKMIYHDLCELYCRAFDDEIVSAASLDTMYDICKSIEKHLDLEEDDYEFGGKFSIDPPRKF
jgi:hypothetical protein